MREIVTTITSKGQTTIPAEIRRHLGLKTSDKISFVVADDGKVYLKAPRYPDIESVVGAAGVLSAPLPWPDVRRIAEEDQLADNG